MDESSIPDIPDWNSFMTFQSEVPIRGVLDRHAGETGILFSFCQLTPLTPALSLSDPRERGKIENGPASPGSRWHSALGY